MKKSETTINDVLKAVNEFSGHMDKRMSPMEFDIGALKQGVTQIKLTMVTKEYLDDKLADLRGEMTIQDNQISKKVDTLTNVLSKKKVITPTE